MDTIGASGNGQHCRNKHFPIYTVFDVGDGGIPEGHFRRKFGVSGIDIPEIVAADLCAYPFTVRVLVYGGFRRLKSLDKITERDPFGGTIGVFALQIQPCPGDIVGGKLPAVFFDDFLSQNDIIGVVIHRHPVYRIRIAPACKAEIVLVYYPVVQIGVPDIAVHRGISCFFQERDQFLRFNAFNGFS